MARNQCLIIIIIIIINSLSMKQNGRPVLNEGMTQLIYTTSSGLVATMLR